MLAVCGGGGSDVAATLVTALAVAAWILQLPKIITTLLLPGLIGPCATVATRAAPATQAFFLALWGSLFLVGTYTVLVFSFLLVGSGCWGD